MSWATLSAAANRVAFNRLGGVSVTAGAVSGDGILDQNSELVMNGQVVSVAYALSCETAVFGSLEYGDLITVDGNTYRVQHEPLRIGDGSNCVVPLSFEAAAVNSFLITSSGNYLVTQDGRRLLISAA